MTPQTSGILFVCGVIMALGGAPIVVLAGLDLGPEVALRTTGERVAATVTDHRTMRSSRRGTSHQVRYRFEWAGHRYTHSDATGRSNLWTSLPESDWNRAVKSGKVPVLVLPQAPRHNRLVAARFPLGDKLAGLGLGLTLLVGGVLAALKALWALARG